MPARRQSVRDYSFGRDIQQIYSIGECLGTGNYGTVRVCELRSNSPSEAHVIIGATSQAAMKRRVEEQMLLTAPIAGEKLACKTIFNAELATKADALAVHTEIQAMRIVDCHPNVVQLRDGHRDKEGMHLVMELMTGGDLYEELSCRGHFSESEAAGVFRQLVVAAEYLHSKKIFHRDLKLENCLLTWPHQEGPGGTQGREETCTKGAPGTSRILRFRKGGVGGMGGQPPTREPGVKIADFGLCVLLKGDDDRVVDLAGSPFYMAPKLLHRTPYGTKADIWSLGVILYTLLSGRFPFAGDSRRAMAESMSKRQVSFPSSQWQNVSKEAKCLLRRILQPDPDLRPSAREVLHDRWLVTPRPAHDTWRDMELTRSQSPTTKPQVCEIHPRETCARSAMNKTHAGQLSPIQGSSASHSSPSTWQKPTTATSNLIPVACSTQLAAQVAIAGLDSCPSLFPPPATTCTCFQNHHSPSSSPTTTIQDSPSQHPHPPHPPPPLLPTPCLPTLMPQSFSAPPASEPVAARSASLSPARDCEDLVGMNSLCPCPSCPPSPAVPISRKFGTGTSLRERRGCRQAGTLRLKLSSPQSCIPSFSSSAAIIRGSLPALPLLGSAKESDWVVKTVIELKGGKAGFGGNGRDEVHAEKVPEMSSQEAKAGRCKIFNAFGRIWSSFFGQLSQVELSFFT